jgi:SAM-dependent methyltransferase
MSRKKRDLRLLFYLNRIAAKTNDARTLGRQAAKPLRRYMDAMTHNLRPCNLCGELKQIEVVFRRSGYSIVRCRSCGMVYTNRIPDADEMDRIYQDGYFGVDGKYAGEGVDSSRVNAEQRVAQLLARPGMGRDCWLDVGCATGSFLLAARPQVDRVEGIEYSAHAAQRARTAGLERVRTGDFLELELDGDAYDLVSMWDVIEHLADPSAAVHRAFQVLKAGGWLTLSTGDVGSLAARIMGRYWHLMTPPQHLYFFSRPTITRLLAGAGFETIQIDYPGKRVPLDFMAEKVTRLILPAASPAVLGLARRLRLGACRPVVNLWDIMTVMARKPG